MQGFLLQLRGPGPEANTRRDWAGSLINVNPSMKPTLRKAETSCSPPGQVQVGDLLSTWVEEVGGEASQGGRNLK